MEEPGREPPFGVLLLACCLALVQAAVAVTERQPLAWGLAAVDLGLAAGLWGLRPWARWATLARCVLLLGLLAARAATAGVGDVAWPPVAVALFGVVYLALPATGRAFGRGGRGPML